MEDEKEILKHKIHILKTLDADIREHRQIDIHKGYQQTRRKISRKSRRLSIFHFLNRAAAILIIPLLISTGVLLYKYLEKGNEDNVVAYTEIMALPGTITKTQLPDSSEVWLNSGSSLRYPIRFASDKRAVELTGEAFFDIRSQACCPFEVKTSEGLKITARGTSFNINAYPEDLVTETILQTGIIDVSYNESILGVSPNEMVTFDKTTGVMRKTITSIEEKTAWKDGLLVFRSTPLEEVFKRISRRYNVEIVLHKETEVDYRIRATFSSETLSQILDVLKMAVPTIRWSETKMQQKTDLTYARQRIEVWIK